MNYQIKTSRTFEDDKLREAWHWLYAQGDYKPQSSYEWMSIWWKHYSNKNRQLFVITIEEDDRIVGIGPFMVDSYFSFKQLKFIGAGLTDFHEILAIPEKSDEIITQVIQYILCSKGINIINLEQVPDNSKTYNILNKHFQKREMIKCPIINFNSESWDEYKKKLSQNLRKDWNRKFNRLSKSGILRVQNIETNQDKKAVAENLFKIHVKRWGAEKQASKFAEKKLRNFIGDILDTFNESSIYLLKYNDQTVSYVIGFMQDDCFYHWNNSFDPDFKNHSVGGILDGLMFKDLIEKRIKKFNFMRGNYEYKRRWMTDEETITNYQFLLPVTAIKGYLGVRYYMEWKWWIKTKFIKILNDKRVRKLLNKIRY